MQFRNLTVLKPGGDADRLIECLRERAKPYGVGVQPDSTGPPVMVTDQGDAVDDLSSFLEQQLDDCASETGLDWHEYIQVPHGPE